MKTIVKKVLLSLLVVVSFNLSALADNGEPVKDGEKTVKATGKIVDQLTGEPLTGVKIVFEGSDEVIYTDFDGQFELFYSKKQTSELSVSLISYEDKKIELSKGKEINIALKRIK